MRCILGVALLLLGPSSGLYEKEAGHFDWLMTFIGSPTALLESKTTPNSILVASDTANMGLLHVASGEYIWTQMVSRSNERITQWIESPGGHVVVKVGKSTLVSVNASNGVVNWTSRISPNDSLVGCSESNAIKLSDSGRILDASDGSPRSDSTKCDTASPSMSASPITVDGLKVVADSHGRLTAFHGNKEVWSREESLGSVLDALIITPSESKTSETRHDLSWLIGSHKTVVALSKSHRLVAFDLATRTTLAVTDVDPAVVSLSSKSNGNSVELLNAKGSTVRLLGINNGRFEDLAVAQVISSSVQFKIVQDKGIISGVSANQEVYKIDLQAPIVKEIYPSHTEYENVPVLVRGDASVVFKYMNPNLVAFIAAESKGISITLVDSVTGSVPHQTLVETASADPDLLHFVLCDNWIVGHYFNVESNRFEVIAIDLFDNKPDKGFMAAASGDVETAKSAFELPIDPTALVQQYVFPPGPVNAMAVTSTLKGVTPRQVLFATSNGVLAIRKDTWLNPRRVGAGSLPTRLAVTSEEQLPPYAPVLPVIQTDIVSHLHILENVRIIRTVPTHLESTSIMIAFGQEGKIFTAPVYIGNAPFDVLSPFFDYWLLYASITFVVTGVVVTSILGRRAELYDKWK